MTLDTYEFIHHPFVIKRKVFYNSRVVVVPQRIHDSIVNLKIEDIDWKQRRISIIQEKTKHPLVLPLSIDAGRSHSFLS